MSELPCSRYKTSLCTREISHVPRRATIAYYNLTIGYIQVRHKQSASEPKASLGKSPCFLIPLFYTCCFKTFATPSITPCSMHGMQLNEVHVFAHNSNLSENSGGGGGGLSATAICCNSKIIHAFQMLGQGNHDKPA